MNAQEADNKLQLTITYIQTLYHIYSKDSISQEVEVPHLQQRQHLPGSGSTTSTAKTASPWKWKYHIYSKDSISLEVEVPHLQQRQHLPGSGSTTSIAKTASPWKWKYHISSKDSISLEVEVPHLYQRQHLPGSGSTTSIYSKDRISLEGEVPHLQQRQHLPGSGSTTTIAKTASPQSWDYKLDYMSLPRGRRTTIAKTTSPQRQKYHNYSKQMHLPRGKNTTTIAKTASPQRQKYYKYSKNSISLEVKVQQQQQRQHLPGSGSTTTIVKTASHQKQKFYNYSKGITLGSKEVSQSIGHSESSQQRQHLIRSSTQFLFKVDTFGNVTNNISFKLLHRLQQYNFYCCTNCIPKCLILISTERYRMFP